MRWRVGRSVGRNVYENDQLMFLCTTLEDAVRIVGALRRADRGDDRERPAGRGPATEITAKGRSREPLPKRPRPPVCPQAQRRAEYLAEVGRVEAE